VSLLQTTGGARLAASVGNSRRPRADEIGARCYSFPSRLALTRRRPPERWATDFGGDDARALPPASYESGRGARRRGGSERGPARSRRQGGGAARAGGGGRRDRPRSRTQLPRPMGQPGSRSSSTPRSSSPRRLGCSAAWAWTTCASRKRRFASCSRRACGGAPPHQVADRGRRPRERARSTGADGLERTPGAADAPARRRIPPREEPRAGRGKRGSRASEA
jgi:hypothetical protein